MAEQEIITRYKAIVDDQIKGIDLIIDKVRQLVNSQKTQADAETTNAAKLKTAAQQRKILLDQEIANLKKLQEASKQAFTVKDISAFNQQINESQKRIAVLKGDTDSLSSITSSLKAGFLELGAGILATFSVNAVIGFAKDSVRAFQEAEATAKSLKFSVTEIGKEGEIAFERLIEQSKELQKISVFSSGDIQKAQDQLSTFGLLSDEIEKLIPKIIDFASKKNISLVESTSLVIRGINGETKALKPLGLEFEKTGDRTKNLAIISEKLNRFQGATASALDTSAGKAANLGNQFDELKESIGGFIERTGILQKVSGGLSSFFDGLIFALKSNKEVLDDVTKGTVKGLIEGLQKEIDASVKAGKTVQQAIEDEQKRIDNAQKLRQQERIVAAEKGDTAELNRISALQRALILEEKALDIIRQQQQVKKSGLGLTDEQQTNLETEARKASEERVKKAQETADKLVEIQKANSQKLIELRIKSEDDLKTVKAADDPIKKLDLEYDKRLQDAVRVFNLTKKSAEDRENLAATLANIEISFEKQVSDATIKIALETKKKLDDLNKDNAEKDLADTLATIDLVGSEQKLALQKQFAERGDFSKEAADKLSKEISAVELNADIAKQKEIIASNASSNKEILEAKTKLNDDLAALSKAGSENEIEADDAATQKKIDNIFKILEVSDQVFSAIAQIESNASQKRIEALQEQLQASQDVLDKEQEAVDNQKNAKLISEREYESQSAVIKQKRIDSEKKINAAINAEKRKQAELDRALKIFEIAIQTAQNAVAVFPLTVPPGLLVPLAIALGALETAAVLSAPLPKFAKGTKDKKGSGMAIVGEEGEELVNLPSSSQVLPAPKTKKNRELINAMFDDKIDEYIHKKYVLPEVKNEKLSAMKKFEILKQVYEKEVVVNYNEKIFKQYEASKTISLNAIAKNYINSIVENRIDSKLSTKTIQLKEQINNFVNTKSIHEFTSNKPISPILMESKEKNRTAIQEQKSKNLAQNITNSFVNNKINSTGLDEHGMMRVNSKGIKIRNFEQLAEAIAQKIIQEENFRR